ncbi:MAG: alpha amylase C-terminal domain-containing protein, partial [Bacteroidota bacterium]
ALPISNAYPAQQLNMDTTNKTIIFERNNLLFLFNFHPSNSIPDYLFSIPIPGDYKAILISDEGAFGGHDRVDKSVTYTSHSLENENKLSVYLTSRTAMVLKKI